MLTDHDYTMNVLARRSTQWHGDKMDFSDLRDVLAEFIEVGNRLDRAKKTLFYGRAFSWGENADNFPIGTPTPAVGLQETDIIHAILGAATEGVELVEALHKFFFDSPGDEGFDHVNLQEEFGDLAWYRALGLFALNQTHQQNIEQNDAKLEKRFGPAFTQEAANNRDLAGEREVLEGNS
jgi:NTP pyrophosphatase (non-canonical NTP hydrolase)